jgi:hypothetical protein
VFLLNCFKKTKFKELIMHALSLLRMLKMTSTSPHSPPSQGKFSSRAQEG